MAAFFHNSLQSSDEHICVCNLTSHPHRGSRVPHLSESCETTFRRGRWRNLDLHAATSTPSASKTDPKGDVFHVKLLIISHNSEKTNINLIKHGFMASVQEQHESWQREGGSFVLTHLHTILWFLDGVMQQTLESTFKRPALLHKRLITADTPIGDSRRCYS